MYEDFSMYVTIKVVSVRDVIPEAKWMRFQTMQINSRNSPDQIHTIH